MHFLCLHGVGSNAQIMQVQTAALRYELGSEHTFEWVEGYLPCGIAPDVKALAAAISGSSSGSSRYYSYFDTTPSSLKSALDLLTAYVDLEGPYDGVIGFSQGACLAATLLAQKKDKDEAAPFRLAIFLSGYSAFDSKSFETDELVQLEAQRDGHLISIPTAHIWASNDQFTGQGEKLRDLCRSQNRFEYMHTAGHAVPKGKSDVIRMAKVVRQAEAVAKDG